MGVFNPDFENFAFRRNGRKILLERSRTCDSEAKEARKGGGGGRRELDKRV